MEQAWQGGRSLDIKEGLRQPTDVDLLRVANGWSETGPAIVRALLKAGADINTCWGVTRATALHAAARRGHLEIARALLDSGAGVSLRDRKGDTALQRAINCRKDEVSQLLLEYRGASQGTPR